MIREKDRIQNEIVLKRKIWNTIAKRRVKVIDYGLKNSRKFAIIIIEGMTKGNG